MARKKRKSKRSGSGWCVYSGKTQVQCHRLKRTAQKTQRRLKAQGKKARLVKRAA